MGDSIREGRPATDIVLERLPATLRLSGITLFFTITGGIGVGVIAALHRNSIVDRLVMLINFVAQSAPNFLIGILLILLMSLHFGWLPSVGDQTWKHYILPVLTVSFGGSAALARLTRSSMLEILNQDFVRTATSKGLRSSAIIFGHVLRNALIPITTQIGLMFAGIVSGAVVIETVFAWPGMGRLLTDAVFDRDYPVLQVIVLMIAFSVVVMNLLTDIAYGWIDPRIRLTESS
jgi:peptide/nickel transport system permease protein